MESSYKIVVLGPPLSGKSTILQEFSEIHAGRLDGYRLPPDPRYGVPYLVLRAKVRLGEADVEVLTIPGGFMGWEVWAPLMPGAHGFVLVLDPQVEHEEDNLACANYLARLPQPTAGCIVVTKQDLVQTRRQDIYSLTSLDTRLAHAEVFLSRFDQPKSLTAPIQHLMAELREGRCHPHYGA